MDMACCVEGSPATREKLNYRNYDARALDAVPMFADSLACRSLHCTKGEGANQWKDEKIRLVTLDMFPQGTQGLGM